MINYLPSTRKLLELLEIPHTLEDLKDIHLSHPCLISLLAISDTVDKHDFSQMPIKIGKEKMYQVSLPYIVQVYAFFEPYNFNFTMNICVAPKLLLSNKDPPLC